MFLRNATSATVMLGPWTGSDGIALTGLTITQSMLMLSKNGTTFVAKNETTNGSHSRLGFYSAMFNNTDTGSLGCLKVVSSAAAALLVWHDFIVLPASEYDARILGSVLQNVNVHGMSNAVVTSAALAAGGVDKMANMLAVGIASYTAAIADRSPASALRAIRNRVTTSGTVMTVYGEDDTTAVWTGTITVNASADPIVEINPA